jgi:hypothetical protein
MESTSYGGAVEVVYGRVDKENAFKTPVVLLQENLEHQFQLKL